jgi:hypothetical protein
MFILQTLGISAVTVHYWGAQQWGTVAQWVGASMTFLAVTVALFKEGILGWLRHPELAASMVAGHPNCRKTPMSQDGWTGTRYFLRLWIENVGKVRAEEVELFLSRAWEEEKPGSWRPVEKFTQMNLRWSYSEYRNPTIHVDGISPGMGRHCDFAAIYDGAAPMFVDGPRTPRLELRTEYFGPPKDYLLPGKYRFEILLGASNRRPALWTVDVHLTSVWSENEAEMFQNGFTVSVRRV